MKTQRNKMDLSYKLDSIPFEKIKNQMNKTLKKYPEIEEKFKSKKTKNLKNIKINMNKKNLTMNLLFGMFKSFSSTFSLSKFLNVAIP